ncbi:MAG: hypothetical protein IPK12_08125 [Gemmatimonadetes bacterium]|nr:hypothetical protein [Gemmatimonadota bacterium]
MRATPIIGVGWKVSALLLALGAPGLAAQATSASGPVRRARAAPEAVLRRLAAELRNLVVAQENYFAENGRYSELLTAAGGGAVLVTPSSGVTLNLTYVTRNSWAARATYEGMRYSCVIIVGAVPASRIPRTRVERWEPTEEGVPVCDRVPGRS